MWPRIADSHPFEKCVNVQIMYSQECMCVCVCVSYFLTCVRTGDLSDLTETNENIWNTLEATAFHSSRPSAPRARLSLLLLAPGPGPGPDRPETSRPMWQQQHPQQGKFIRSHVFGSGKRSRGATAEPELGPSRGGRGGGWN